MMEMGLSGLAWLLPMFADSWLGACPKAWGHEILQEALKVKWRLNIKSRWRLLGWTPQFISSKKSRSDDKSSQKEAPKEKKNFFGPSMLDPQVPAHTSTARTACAWVCSLGEHWPRPRQARGRPRPSPGCLPSAMVFARSLARDQWQCTFNTAIWQLHARPTRI